MAQPVGDGLAQDAVAARKPSLFVALWALAAGEKPVVLLAHALTDCRGDGLMALIWVASDFSSSWPSLVKAAKSIQVLDLCGI